MSWVEDNINNLEGKIRFDQLYGNSYTKRLLESAVPHSVLDDTFHIPNVQAFLLYGKEGCGKRTLAYAFGQELMDKEYEFVNIDCTSLIGKNGIKTCKKLEEFFDDIANYYWESNEEDASEDEEAEEDENVEESEDESDEDEEDTEEEIINSTDESYEKKLCILLKNIDLLCKEELVAEYLTSYIESMLDKLMSEELSCVLLATTNKIESVPVSLRNTMLLCHVDLPDEEERTEYLKYAIESQNLFIEYTLTYEKMAKQTEGFDYKKLSRLVKNMMFVLKKEFHKWSKQWGDGVRNDLVKGLKEHSCVITQELLDQILEQMKEPAVNTTSQTQMVIGQGFMMPQQMRMETNNGVMQEEQLTKETEKIANDSETGKASRMFSTIKKPESADLSSIEHIDNLGKNVYNTIEQEKTIENELKMQKQTIDFSNLGKQLTM